MGTIKRCLADAAFSDAVRESRGHTCEHCKRVGRCEAAHIYGRANKAVRWDTMNILCLCHTCHRYFTENPIDFNKWLDAYLGQGHLDILREKSQAIFKTTKAVRADIARHYRAQLKLIRSGNYELESYQ